MFLDIEELRKKAVNDIMTSRANSGYLIGLSMIFL